MGRRNTRGLTKFCNQCKEEKAVSLFGKRADRHDGLTSECKTCMLARQREYNLKKRYGLSPTEAPAVLASVNLGCEICKKEIKVGTKDWAVDHDHLTGKIRGILCSSCNTGLGFFRDSAFLLAKAINYVNRQW